MKVRAPGKLVLTGAYAVLEGAPALVLAIDRHAIADTSHPEPNPGIEVRAALEAMPEVAKAPSVDARALHDAQGQKLGLGSSAAVLVASLGALAAARGDDHAQPSVRREIFRAARAAHARSQQGGSGVDIAASVFGGLLRYQLPEGGLPPDVRAVELPRGLRMAAYWTGVPARTSELRAKVDALRARDGKAYDARMRDLADASNRAADAVSAQALITAARSMGAALFALGREADAPIVTLPMAELALRVVAEEAAFLPSGAGGGDCAVYLGIAPPSEAFDARARACGMTPLDLAPEPRGVCLDHSARKDD